MVLRIQCLGGLARICCTNSNKHLGKELITALKSFMKQSQDLKFSLTEIEALRVTFISYFRIILDQVKGLVLRHLTRQEYLDGKLVPEKLDSGNWNLPQFKFCKLVCLSLKAKVFVV